MIPSARFGDIRIVYNGGDFIECELYSLYGGGIAEVALNKEFCLFILTELYHKVSLHDRAAIAWDGATSREEAEALFNKPDETSHLFYKEARALLKGTRGGNSTNDAIKLPDEDKFRIIASKVIKDFSIADLAPMDGTLSEYGVLEIKVNNTKLISHIAPGLLVEC